MRIFWRWLRYVLAVFAALLMGGVAWIGWLLSGQRYQTLLTEQLSALLGAQVQVERSHLSLRSGLGLQLDSISVRDEGRDDPLFVADSVDLLLDLAALWQGAFLFDRIEFVKPRVQMDLAGERLLRIVRRIRESSEANGVSESWFSLKFTPTLAVQELKVRNAEISYPKTKKHAALLFAGTEAALVFSEDGIPTFTVRTTLKEKNDDIGQVFLRATSDQGVDFATLPRSEWSGEIELSEVHLQRVGKIFAEDWPALRFAVSGRFRGKGEGPVTFVGMLSADETQIGAIRLSDLQLRILRAQWDGGEEDSWLRTLSLEGKIMRLQGEVGDDAAILAVSEGELTLQGENFSFARLSGVYGKKSRFTDASVSLRNVLTKEGPQIHAQITADLDLADDLPRLITALTPISERDFSQVLLRPGGRALAQVQVRRANARSLPIYEGFVTFRDARVHVLPWQFNVDKLDGVVRIDANVLSSDTLTFKLGQSALKAQVRMQNFLSSHRSADVRLVFSSMRDYDVASLLPPGDVIPQGGLLDGDMNIFFPSFQETPRLTGRLKLARVRFDLLDFLHSFEVTAGELDFKEQEVSFNVQKGQLPGGVFSGQGRVASWTPLRLEIVGDFPDLDLGVALALDKRDDGQPKDATRDVQASLTSQRMVYKDAEIDNLKLFCHWHDRQADLRIEGANVAGGKMDGEAVLWPDFSAAFLHPHLTQVDVERFFHAIGVSSNALAGTLNGEGRIYMPQWGQWEDLALWNASLSLRVENGMAQRLPLLVRLWSVISMQGLLQLQLPSLPTGGFPFVSFTGDFVLGNGHAVTNNLSLNGDSVRLDASGKIDLERHVLDLKTALVPLHGITRNVAKVPLAGKLLAQSANYLTTLNFHVSGTYDDPSVTPILP